VGRSVSRSSVEVSVEVSGTPTTEGARGDATALPGLPRVRSGSLLGYGDLPVDDLLLEVLELGLDVVDLAAGGGVVDAALLRS
jgi:hypothetical protein